MRPEREEDSICLACLLTHTFAWPWDKHVQGLKKSLSGISLACVLCALFFQRIQRTHDCEEWLFDCRESLLLCQWLCVVRLSAYTKWADLKRKKETTQCLQVTAYSVSAGWFNPSDCWVLKSTVTLKWVECKLLQQCEDAFGCWGGKLPESESANLPTRCRVLLTSANSSLLLSAYNSKAKRLVSPLQARVLGDSYA